MTKRQRDRRKSQRKVWAAEREYRRALRALGQGPTPMVHMSEVGFWKVSDIEAIKALRAATP